MESYSFNRLVGKKTFTWIIKTIITIYLVNDFQTEMFSKNQLMSNSRTLADNHRIQITSAPAEVLDSAGKGRLA